MSPAAAMTSAPELDDATLVARVLAGDEPSFEALVRRHHGRLVRVARVLLPRHALAEELVQECWMSALERLEKFEGRSSVSTWLIAIVSNRAKSLAQRERCRSAWTELDSALAGSEPVVPLERFTANGRSWVSGPNRWAKEMPDAVLRQAQARAALEQALESLPEAQRAVVTLRDVDGLSADEVCEAMALSAANQRVLLHRGRAKLRALLEGYADGI